MADTLTVERNIQGVSCLSSTGKAHAIGAKGFLPVVMPDENTLFRQATPAAASSDSFSTAGEDYQIDSNRLKAGSAYLVGSLGDMLEDVNRQNMGSTACATDGATLKNAAGAAVAVNGLVASAVTPTVVLDNAGTANVDVGDFLKIGNEYVQVSAKNADGKTLTIVRNIAPGPVPCQGTVLTSTSGNLADGAAIKKVIVPSRAPTVGLLGGTGTSFFASPWDKGGNVTDFCYEASTRFTTISTAMTATAPTSLTVASLDALGAVVGDYIQVVVGNGDAGTTPTASPGTGEYMKVTGVSASTGTLTVIRSVAPTCLEYAGKYADEAWGASAAGANNGRYVFLLKRAYGKVQLMDSVAKTGEGCPFVGETLKGAAGAAVLLTADIAAGVTTITIDSTVNVAPGDYLGFGPKGVGVDGVGAASDVTEIVKVVSVTDATTLEVIRVNAPGPAGCVPNTATALKDDGIVHVVKPAGLSASGSCATKLDTTNGVAKVKAPGMLAAGNGGQSATFTFDNLNPAESTTARRAFRVGGYIMIKNEVMAVTGVTKTSATEGVLSVVRGVDLPCLKSEAGATAHATADLKTTLTTTAKTVHIDQAYNRAHVGGYLFINNEYMLITDIDVRTGTELDVTVTRNSAPPCVLGATVTSTALAADEAAANNIVKILTLPGP